MADLAVHVDEAAVLLDDAVDRVAGVDAEIRKHLVDLGGVDHDRRRGGARRPDKFDVLAKEAPEQLEHGRDGVREVKALRRNGLLSREGQELTRQIGRPMCAARDFLQVGPRRMVGLQMVEGQIDIAKDGHEHVVEIVRHAAGQPPDGLHLLRLPQLVFQRQALGDVPENADEAGPPVQF